MGYRIIYGKKNRTVHRKGAGKTAVAIAVVAITVLATIWSVFGWKQRLGRGALENMAEAVKNGESVSDALVAFCQEIIAYGQLAQ